jgi:putative transposase
VRICRVIEVSPNGYYKWKSGKTGKRTESDIKLFDEIKKEYDKSLRRYGSPRIERQLRKRKIRTSEKRVARLMRQNNLKSIIKKKYKATTNSNHSLPVSENLLKQNF